jgi:rubredoxin
MKKRYRCTICEHIYDPAEGDPAANIPPGTAFEDLPADWVCPDCGASKDDYEPVAD